MHSLALFVVAKLLDEGYTCKLPHPLGSLRDNQSAKLSAKDITHFLWFLSFTEHVTMKSYLYFLKTHIKSHVELSKELGQGREGLIDTHCKFDIYFLLKDIDKVLFPNVPEIPFRESGSVSETDSEDFAFEAESPDLRLTPQSGEEEVAPVDTSVETKAPSGSDQKLIDTMGNPSTLFTTNVGSGTTTQQVLNRNNVEQLNSVLPKMRVYSQPKQPIFSCKKN